MNTTKHLRGFSLLEILAVVAIMGILAMISLGPIHAAQIRGRDSQRKADVNTLSQAIESFYADQRTVPDGTLASCSLRDSTQSAPWIPGLSSYITSTQGKALSIPVDPKNNATYRYTYQCFQNDPAKRYRVTAQMENAKDVESVNGIYTIER
jgi:prepilin-type N-terminal cleavage/methylation domain-containing protein